MKPPRFETLLDKAPPAEAFCPLYRRCGGCSLQHIDYNAQLRAKQRYLEETMRQAGMELDALPVNIVPSAPKEYRNRLGFHALRSNRGPKTAFKARRGSELLPVDDCPIADPVVRKTLREGSIIPPPGKDRFTVYGKDNTVIAEAEINGRFKQRGEFSYLEKKLIVDAGCFFQSNAAMLEKLLLHLRNIAAGIAQSGIKGGVGDLYAGVGTFPLFYAEFFEGVIDLIEENGLALELAKTNLARHCPQGKFRYFAQKAEKWKARAPWCFAVADPPRQGLAANLRELLTQSGPAHLAYVSCDPLSLARDCRALKKSYILKELTLYDFYPQTPHIESLAILERSTGT
ncbi:MAG: class I SAM-dependent RNA methyltransferase [Treponema sp.]|jgi:23S rRNA (uracil1939-C5)-methyltransferase|nr:class I SAM-dependent RNA methyltransferase [Treponema sp.]